MYKASIKPLSKNWYQSLKASYILQGVIKTYLFQ